MKGHTDTDENIISLAEVKIQEYAWLLAPQLCIVWKYGTVLYADLCPVHTKKDISNPTCISYS